MMREKHGKRWTRTYGIWLSMRQRCRNPNNPDYSYYGGRGITVCPRWDSYTAFLSDMGEAPAGMSIEREDNDKGYEPGNCRWATREAQMRNTRRSKPIRFRGEERTLVEWAEHFNVPRKRIRSMMERHPTDKIFTDIVEGRWP